MLVRLWEGGKDRKETLYTVVRMYMSSNNGNQYEESLKTKKKGQTW
jgi:hypothetical protein